MSKHPITLGDLKAIATDEGVSFCPGDILIVRSGWIKWYEENDEDQRLRYITKGGAWVGVEGCRETLEWLWNQHFAAVAGDSIGWEVWPPKPGYSQSPENLVPLSSISPFNLQDYTTTFSRYGVCQSEKCGTLRH